MITSELTFNMEFPQHNDFKKSYFRNNRACGQKNIRCFPACADEHVEKHFCGRPLKVILEIEVQDGPFTCSQIMEEIRLIARFEVLGPDVSGIREPVSGSVLKSLIKTKANPTNPYFYGKVVETKASLKTDKGTLHRCVVDFNSECKGWHYAWVGNRFRSNIPHIVSVSVMRVDRELSFGKDCPAVSTSELANQFGTQSIVFRPMAHFNSPSFLIASLRRKEEKVDEEEKAEEEVDGKEGEKEVDDDVPLSELVNKTPTVKQQSMREVEQESIREIQSDTLLGANANEERANSAAAKVVTSESYDTESTKRTSASTHAEEKQSRSDREKRDVAEGASGRSSSNDKDSVANSSSTSNGTSNSSSNSSGGIKLKDVNLSHVLLQGNFISHTSSSPTPTAAAPVASSSRISQRQHRSSQQASDKGAEKFSETEVQTTTGTDAHGKQASATPSSSPLNKVSTPASPAPVTASMKASPAAGAAVVTGAAAAVGDVSSLPSKHHIPLIPRVQTSIPTNDANNKNTAMKSYKNETPNQFTLPSRSDINNSLLSFSQQPLLHPMLSPMTDPFGRPMMMPQQTAHEPILFSQHEQLNANLTLQHQQLMQRQQQEMWVKYNLMQQQMYLNMMSQQSQSQANSSSLSSVPPSYLTASASAQLNQQMSNINSINSSSSNNGGYLFPTNSSHYSTRSMTNQGSQPNTSAYSQTIQPLPLPSTFSAGKLSQMPPQLINPQFLRNPSAMLPPNDTALSPAAAAHGKYNRAYDSMQQQQQQQLTAADGAPVWNCFKPTPNSPTTITSAVAAGNGRKVFGLPLDVFSDVVYDEETSSGVAGLLDCPEHSAVEAALSYLSEVRAREAAVEKQTELLMQILSAPCAALDLLADITNCWQPPDAGAAGIDVIDGVGLPVDSGSVTSPLSEMINTPFARSTRSSRSMDKLSGVATPGSVTSDQAHRTSERSNNANNSSYSSNKRKAVGVDELLFSETDDFYAANYKRASSNNNSSNKAQESDNLSGEKRQHKCPRCGAPKRGHRCSKVLPQTVRNKSLRFIGASSELFAPADGK